MSGRLLVRAAVAGSALLVLAGCGERPGYDRASVEGYLARAQSGSYGADAKVGRASCPEKLALKEGMRFTCTLDVSGSAVPYRVRLTHVQARKVTVQASPAGVVLPEVAVRDFVRSTLPRSSKGAGVDCGRRYLVAKVGQTLACKLTLGAQQKDIKVTVRDERGTIAVTS
jgi:hypothetical protein